jgi:hypothetical protein
LTKLHTKQLGNRRRRDDLIFPLDLDLEFLLQPPATAIRQSFGRPVCTFLQAPSIQLQPMLSTAFHPAVASTAFRRRVRRRSPAAVTVVVLFWSKDQVVFESSSEGFDVIMAA